VESIRLTEAPAEVPHGPKLGVTPDINTPGSPGGADGTLPLLCDDDQVPGTSSTVTTGPEVGLSAAWETPGSDPTAPPMLVGSAVVPEGTGSTVMVLSTEAHWLELGCSALTG
jgi:hypothetical protein